MLVLTRTIGETIVIDGCIEVTITAVDRNKVRLGITAPPEVRITRAELLRRLQDVAELELAGAAS